MVCQGLALTLPRGEQSSCCQAANYNKTTITKQFYYILDFLSRAVHTSPPSNPIYAKSQQIRSSSQRQRLRLWNLHTDGAKPRGEGGGERRVRRTYGKCLSKTIKSNTLKSTTTARKGIWTTLTLSVSIDVFFPVCLPCLSGVCPSCTITICLVASPQRSMTLDSSSTWTMVSA